MTIREILEEKVQKGQIDPLTFLKANVQLTGLLEKTEKLELIKGGEGSRGGKVIGHTSNGTPIYEHSKEYADHAVGKLKNGENHRRIIERGGQKMMEHFQPGKKKGTYDRHHLAPNGDKSTAVKQNSGLSEEDVHRHLMHSHAEHSHESEINDIKDKMRYAKEFAPHKSAQYEERLKEIEGRRKI